MKEESGWPRSSSSFVTADSSINFQVLNFLDNLPVTMPDRSSSQSPPLSTLPFRPVRPAEVGDGVELEVMEFLVNNDAGVLAYCCVATMVTFAYPLTTAVGDSRSQESVATVAQELSRFTSTHMLFWPPLTS